jgi:iron complex outermembrane receptor protein
MRYNNLTSVISRILWLSISGAIGVSGMAAAQTESTDRKRLEPVVVTAQKVEQTLQSAPVAVSAVTGEELKVRQIADVSDLQFSIPNFSFARTNFSSSNLQIRGIASEIITSSADSGIAVLIDDHYLAQPRLNDLQHYDIQRIEVLRGPQGTLYGRNASGGSVNMITQKPELGVFEGYGSATIGNYNTYQGEGAVNLPLGNTAALRLSGAFTKRDGFTDNVNPDANFDTVDGREVWSVRSILRWEPVETTRLDLLVQYLKEDDNKMRATKQLCDTDPTPVLGCTPSGLGRGGVNPDAEVWNIIAAGAGVSLSPWGIGASAIVPSGLRETYLDFEPQYEAEELIVGLSAEHELSDSLTLNFLATIHEDEEESFTDFNNSVGAAIPAAVADFYNGLLGLPANGLMPISAPSSDHSSDCGVFCGNTFGSYGYVQAIDDSRVKSSERTFELRLTSDYDSVANFMLAGFYHNLDKDADYYTSHSQLDALAIALTGGFGGIAPYFRSEVDATELESWAVFGELYLDILPDVRITQGLRYTHDDLGVRNRLLFLSPESTPYTQNNYENDVLTGRMVVDWTPDLSFTDETLVYGSFSRGYKGGGFNPAVDRELFPDVKLNYEPEFVNSYEIGTKNLLLDGTLQANLAAFYYDYQGLQIEQVVAQSAVTDNVDTTIWGIESEFVFQATDNLQFNWQVSYLDTEVGRFSTIDTRDPSGGLSDLTLLKDLASGANCVIFHNGNAPITADMLDTLTGGQFSLLVPDGAGGLAPGSYAAGTIPGVAAPAALLSPGPGACAQSDTNPATMTLGDLLAGTGYTVGAGAPYDLTGNELQNAPSWNAGIGAQYTHRFENGYQLVGRADYYWQDESWARVFNNPNLDKLKSWSRLNLQLTLSPEDERWYARAYVKNLADNDVIVGTDSTDPIAGIFTNVFLLEPRQYGVSFGVRF